MRMVMEKKKEDEKEKEIISFIKSNKTAKDYVNLLHDLHIKYKVKEKLTEEELYFILKDIIKE